jgi:hypothetical protein
VAIWNFRNLKSSEFEPFFFSQKILCTGRNHIFQVEIWEKFSGKRNTEILESNITIYFWGLKIKKKIWPPFSPSL